MGRFIKRRETRLSYLFLALVVVFLLSSGFTSTTFASDLGLTEADCRCCHGTTLADRHHLLVNTSGRECLSCHPLTLNPDTLTYDLTVTRNCPQCHTGSLADRHHLLVDQVTFDCFTCHAIVWDPVALQYVADFNKTCQTPPQPAAAGAISGTVTNSGGTGIGWAKVATSDGAYSTLATATGSYELSSVTPGSYTLVATLDGYEGTSQSITVVDGQTLSTDLVLTPLPVPATVAGVVSDTNETPLEGASIASADGILSTTSGADGSYALTNVAEGSINLIAVKPGYTGVTQAVTITAGQNLAQNFVLPAAVEICTDGVDNNANGLTDCDDSACSSHASCQAPAVEICGDGLDNNANGLIDCNDPTCIGTGTCESPIVEICNDSIDNNGDGLLDCDDPLCSTSSYCLPETCDDGVDNNGDSLIDCNDPTCADTSICRPPPVEICEDGIDNDANGLIDCDDAKCTDLPACTPPVPDELCNNGADDDGDGYIDCADPQCQDRAVCLDESCENDDDDDGDGRVDCEDLECRETPACSGQLGGVSLDFSVRASKEKDGYEAENAGDHDLVSRWWVDKDHRQWLMLDLGGRYPIDRVDIHWHSSLFADKYKIRVSRNKRHWRTVASVTNGAGGLESSIFETRGARFVLIQCKTPASSGYSIHEVEVFRSATDVDDHH